MFRRLTHTAVQAAIAAFMMAAELAGAAASPVLAWHKVFQAAGDMATAGLVCDASGSAYLAYTFNQSSGTVVHLAKITPNAAVLFDKTITFDRAFTNPVLVISPIINNVQYLYLAGALTDATNRKIVYVNKYSTDGASLWASPFTFATDAGQDAALAGIHPDLNGALFLIMHGLGVAPYNHPYGQLDQLSPSGSILTSVLESNIDPVTAYFDDVARAWTVFGPGIGGPYQAGYMARGKLDPVTAADVGTFKGPLTMPAGIFALPNSYNADFTAVPAPQGSRQYELVVFLPNDCNSVFYWPYLIPFAARGSLTQVASADEDSTIYALGKLREGDTFSFLERFAWWGGHLSYQESLPVDQLFPTDTGFFSVFHDQATNTLRLARYQERTMDFDWQTNYMGSGVAPNTFGAYAHTSSGFYFAANLANSSSSHSVSLDRYFTAGPCLAGVSAPSTVQGGYTMQIKILLNRSAPPGGISAGLNSSSPKLLMPNGTQSQSFVIPEGMSSIAVTLNAQIVSVVTPVSILALSRGVRRSANVTVMP